MPEGKPVFQRKQQKRQPRDGDQDYDSAQNIGKAEAHKPDSQQEVVNRASYKDGEVFQRWRSSAHISSRLKEGEFTAFAICVRKISIGRRCTHEAAPFTDIPDHSRVGEIDVLASRMLSQREPLAQPRRAASMRPIGGQIDSPKFNKEISPGPLPQKWRIT